MIRTLVVDDDFRVASIHAAYVEKVPGSPPSVRSTLRSRW
jgi:response regulator of citrate/malate metabolism